LIATNPRYEKVLASAGDATRFAQGLQKAGYATDPHYATKLASIIKRSLAG
jgi:flagellar protein FlgJ